MRATVRPIGVVPFAVLASCAAVPDPVFEPLETGVEASLRGLSVPASDVVWASGDGGTVIRSVDAGRTWQAFRVKDAASLDFRSLHAFDARRAVVASAGQPARIYRTIDGGESFELAWESAHEQAFFDAVAFWDDDHGIAFSDPIGGAFHVVVTEDGGRTWSTMPASALPVPLPGEAGFAASGSGVRVAGDRDVWIATGGGARARVLRSNDHGQSWSAHVTPVRAGDPAAGIFSIAVRGDVIVAVGGCYLEPDVADGTAAFSIDAGITWCESEVMPSGYRSSVACFERRGRAVWLCVGRNGADASLDCGRTWRRVGSAAFQAVRVAPDRSVGFAVGASGRAARIRF